MATTRLFLCGDVMLGRGIDQVLPHPSDPMLFEHYVKSAEGYVRLAEHVHGAIPRPVGFDYVWGEALAELERRAPAARIINLETSITTSNDFAPKGINYRMHPDNVGALLAAKIDCCTLANNHVLDWGISGLLETLASLDSAHINYAGAGRYARQAAAPAIIALGTRRILVFGFGFPSSGIPPNWAAEGNKPGVRLIESADAQTVNEIAEGVRGFARPEDILIASIHWGANWGYDVSAVQHAFAHDLIDKAGFCVIHGHSSHHPKAIGVYHGRLILYGCSDFITDYEGIKSHEAFRGDLSLIYLADITPSGALAALGLVPLRMKRFRLERATPSDSRWLAQKLDRESAPYGANVSMEADGSLLLHW